MTKDDLRLYLLLGDFALGNADRHAEILKLLLKRIETIEQFLHLQQVANQMADGEQKQEVLSGVALQAQKLSQLAPLGDEVRSFFARAESQREKIEAILADLRRDL